MHQKFYLFALLCCGSFLAQAQELSPFSELSGRTSDRAFLSQEIEGGHFFYFLRQGSTRFPIYKINHDGVLTDSLPLVRDGIGYGIDALIASNGRYFLTGITFNPNPDITAAEAVAAQQKYLTEIDEQLNVLSTQFYNIYDLPNTFWGQLTYSGNEWASITFPATHKVFGDTLFSIKDYWLSEVDDDFNLLGIDFSKRFEKVGLDGAIYDSGTELPGVYYYQTSAISDEHIFVFGGLRDEGGQNSFPVGRFDRNGNLTGLFTYDPPLGSTAQFYATGQLHQGRLFATYQSESTNLPGCPSESVAIDIRDADSFEAIQQFKLPDCGLRLGLKRPFLFLEDGSFYYLAAGEWAQAETRVYLYKYSSSYELEWQQSYELPSHLPKAIHRTDGDGILIACIDRSSGSTFQLYKLNADGGIITGAMLALPPEPPRVFPNPFQNELNLTVANKAVQARIYAMDGKSYGEFICRNGQLQLGHLPAGPYALQLFDLESGAHLGTQAVIKK